MQSLVRKQEEKKQLGTPDVDGRKILKFIREQIRLATGFICLMMQNSGRLP
jgi:hypothetical protein